MKKIIVLALMGLLSSGLWAEGPARVPAYRGVMEWKQPDGYVLRIYKRGDEHMHWTMTTDGWQIKEDKKGWLKYARTNCKGKTVCHWRKARNEEDRSKYAKRWLNKHGIKKAI